MSEPTINERGIQAARGYLERANHTMTDQFELEGLDVLMAFDEVGDTDIACVVVTRENVDQDADIAMYKTVRSLIADDRFPEGTSRVDIIRILSIAPNRALLRHHRDVQSLEEA